MLNRISKSPPLPALDQRYSIRYKFHLFTKENGVFQDMQITPTKVHGINFWKYLAPREYGRDKTIPNDRGSITKQVKTERFNGLLPNASACGMCMFGLS